MVSKPLMCHVSPHLNYWDYLHQSPSCCWGLHSCVCRCCLEASPWALDFRRPSQHSASHLSDRCLLPKQWVITVLHLSGCTHLVWCSAFLLLFLVMTWHPHLPTKHLFWAKHADALSLSGSICLCLSLSFPTLLFFFHFFLPSFSSSLYCWPRLNNQMDKQIMRGKRENKKRKVFFPPWQYREK